VDPHARRSDIANKRDKAERLREPSTPYERRISQKPDKAKVFADIASGEMKVAYGDLARQWIALADALEAELMLARGRASAND
jgi:hypothetical protein